MCFLGYISGGGSFVLIGVHAWINQTILTTSSVLNIINKMLIVSYNACLCAFISSPELNPAVAGTQRPIGPTGYRSRVTRPEHTHPTGSAERHSA